MPLSNARQPKRRQTLILNSMNNQNNNSNNANNARPDYFEIRKIGPNEYLATFIARELLDEGEPGPAAVLLNPLHQQFPQHPRIAQYLIQALLGSGDFKSAKETAKHLTQLCPDHAVPWVLLGLAHDGLGEDKLATEVFEIALKSEMPDFGSVFSVVSLALKLEDLRPCVLNLASRAVSMEPESQLAWFLLGMVHMAQGAHSEAKSAFARTVQFNPGSRQGKAAACFHARLSQQC